MTKIEMINILCNAITVNVYGNDYKITDINYHFIAKYNNISIYFIAEGRNGGLYSNILSVYDGNKKITYKAQKYLYKYIKIVHEIAWELCKMNYLWDYTQQRPLSESMRDSKIQSNMQRAMDGKKPLYDI